MNLRGEDIPVGRKEIGQGHQVDIQGHLADIQGQSDTDQGVGHLNIEREIGTEAGHLCIGKEVGQKVGHQDRARVGQLMRNIGIDLQKKDQ